MRRFLLKNASLYTRNLLHHSSSTATPLAVSSHSQFRLFSSNDIPAPLPSTTEKPVPPPSIKDSAPIEIEDVDNKEFKAMIEKYFKGDEEMLPTIMEAILKRKLSGKHEDTDDELMKELRPEPIDDVDDEDFEEDFEEMHETDEEIDDLYDARDIVMERMVKDKY